MSPIRPDIGLVLARIAGRDPELGKVLRSIDERIGEIEARMDELAADREHELQQANGTKFDKIVIDMAGGQ